jgi:hypothetical protein
MKKFMMALSAAVILGSSGAAIADGHKQSICHNGSTYNEVTQAYDPISFVITIAGKQTAKAVDKHVENHGDLETYVETGDGDVCDLIVDDVTGEESVVCEVKTLCEADEV